MVPSLLITMVNISQFKVRVSNFGRIKGVHVWEKQLSPFLFICGAKRKELNVFRSPRKSANKNMPVPLPHTINNH